VGESLEVGGAAGSGADGAGTGAGEIGGGLGLSGEDDVDVGARTVPVETGEEPRCRPSRMLLVPVAKSRTAAADAAKRPRRLFHRGCIGTTIG